LSVEYSASLEERDELPDHLFKGSSNLTLLKNLRKLAPAARIVVTAETLASARQMYHEGADYVFIPRIISAHYLADVLQRISSGGGNAIRANAAAWVEKRHEVLA
jgi:thiamine monophosphate synthase